MKYLACLLTVLLSMLLVGCRQESVSEHGPSLDAFVRFGMADERFNRVERYVGAGVVLSSFSRLRPDDRVDLAVCRDLDAGAFAFGE